MEDDSGLAVIARVADGMHDVIKMIGFSIGYSFAGDAGPADGYAQDTIDNIHEAIKLLSSVDEVELNDILTELASAAEEVWLQREAARDRLLKAKEMLYSLRGRLALRG